MYNYKNIRKVAYFNPSITDTEAADMGNAFNANRPIININNQQPQQGSSILPWLLLGGAALAGFGAWKKFGPKIKGWVNTYKTYKNVAPTITENAKGLKTQLTSVRDQYNAAIKNKPRFIPESLAAAWWGFKNRKKLMGQLGAAAKHAEQLESANSMLDNAGNVTK